MLILFKMQLLEGEEPEKKIKKPLKKQVEERRENIPPPRRKPTKTSANENEEGEGKKKYELKPIRKKEKGIVPSRVWREEEEEDIGGKEKREGIEEEPELLEYKPEKAVKKEIPKKEKEIPASGQEKEVINLGDGQVKRKDIAESILSKEFYFDEDISDLVQFLSRSRQDFFVEWPEIEGNEYLIFAPKTKELPVSVDDVPRIRFRNEFDLEIDKWVDAVVEAIGGNVRKAKIIAIVTLENPNPTQEDLNERIRDVMVRKLKDRGVLEENILIKVEAMTFEKLAGLLDLYPWDELKARIVERAIDENGASFLESEELAEKFGEEKLEAVADANNSKKLKDALTALGSGKVFFPEISDDWIYDEQRKASITKTYDVKGNTLEDVYASIDGKQVRVKHSMGEGIFTFYFDEKKKIATVLSNGVYVPISEFVKNKGERARIETLGGTWIFTMVKTNEGERVINPEFEKVSFHAVVDPSLQVVSDFMKKVWANINGIFGHLKENDSEISIGEGRTGLEGPEFDKNDPLNYERYFRILLEDYEVYKEYNHLSEDDKKKLLKSVRKKIERPEFKKKSIIIFGDLACTDLNAIISESTKKKVGEFLKKRGIKVYMIAAAPEKYYGFGDSSGTPGVRLQVRKAYREGKRGSLVGRSPKKFLKTKDQLKIMATLVGAEEMKHYTGKYPASESEEGGEVKWTEAKGPFGWVVWIKGSIDNEERYKLFISKLNDVIYEIKEPR
ncbi:MAG: hypothetical protein ABIH83_03710 [Candidatus Micrarchaeota archaeon]